MEVKSFQKYIILWLSQSVSGLGTSMTGFALVLWAYEQSGSAMSVSMMSFCNYVPYVVLSLFAGSFIDRYNKKMIMLVSDSIAAAGSLEVLANLLMGRLADPDTEVLEKLRNSRTRTKLWENLLAELAYNKPY